MGALIVAGFESEWCEFAQKRMAEMGVAEIRGETALGVTPSEFLDKVQHRQRNRSENDEKRTSDSLGRAWDLAAAAMFIGNADVPNWAWADPRHVHLLEFWANFDPDTVFVLLYGAFAPELKETTVTDLENESVLASEAQNWQNYHVALLHFFHSFRERCLLIHVDQFNGSSKRIVDALTHRFDIPTRRLNRSRNRETSMISYLIAESRFSDVPEMSELLAELEHSADIPRPNSEEDKLSRLTRAQTELEKYQLAVTESVSLKESKAELVQRLTQYDEKARQQTARIESLISSSADNQKRSEALEIECRSLRQTIQRLNQEIALASQNRMDEADRSRNSEDKKLLMLQLAQAREELELYFRKYQDAKRHLTEVLSPESVVPAREAEVPAAKPSDLAVAIDFRNYFEGRGWHNAEQQGRWTGAEELSTVVLPKLEKRNYQLTLKIVDAMSNQHMEQLCVSLNGRRLESKLKVMSDMGGKLAPLRRLRARVNSRAKLVPAELSVSIPKDFLSGSGESNLLALASIAAVSPSSNGHSDGRALSICFESMTIQG